MVIPLAALCRESNPKGHALTWHLSYNREQLLLLEVAMAGFDPHARGVIGHWVQADRQQSRCCEPARKDYHRQWLKFGLPARRLMMASRGTFVSEPAPRPSIMRKMLMTTETLRNLVSDRGWRRDGLLWLLFVTGFLFSLMIRALVV
jgi:hypothetical protein